MQLRIIDLLTRPVVPKHALLFGLVIGAFAWSATVQAAKTLPLIPRADLFGNPEKFYSSISPDGTRLSFVAPLNGVMNLWVGPADRVSEAEPVTRDAGRGISLFANSNFWTYDNRHLVYVQDQNGDGNLHLYAVDIEKRTTTDLTPFDKVRATIVKLSPEVPGEILISLNRRDPQYADLYRLNVTSGELTLVTQNPGFASFIADDRLVPRLATKAVPGGGQDVLKFADDRWQSWITVAPEDSRGSSVLSFDAAGESVFMLDSEGRNTLALVRVELATGKKTVIAEDPRSDIRDVISDPMTGQPVAYAVMVARMEYKALTPRLQGDIDFLKAQDVGDWVLNTRSADDRYWKLTAFTDSAIGAAIYDRQARRVIKPYDPRPKLATAPLVRMHPVTIQARDGVELISYLSLPKGSDTAQAGKPDIPVPLVMLVHGGPHNRDVYGFNAQHQWLANRGYAVLSVNYRGSTGFGKAFLNGSIGQWGAKLDDDLLDAVAWAVRNRIADPKRTAIMGGSYGGYAALAGMTRNPDTYACGVDLYGISDLESVRQESAVFIRTTGAVFPNEVGDPNTDEGRASIRERSPINHVDRIKGPLLVAQGANDPAVVRSQSDRMVAAVKAHGTPVTYLLYPDEGHGFQRAPNNLSFFAVAERFLAQCLGGRFEPITADSLNGSSVQVLEGADHIEGLTAALAGTNVSRP